MKWFKHYSNAHTNQLIQSIIQDSGLEDAMRYWLLLELLCGEFKKNTTVFRFSNAQLKTALHIKFDRKLVKFLQLLTESQATFDQLSLNFSQESKNFWKIETSIILDLMGKDFKRTRQTSVTDTSKKKEEEERIKNKNKQTKKCNFDFEEIYSLYPKKQGKTKGLVTCVKTITSEKDFLLLEQCVKNYAEQCKFEDTEKKYIKQFSTFMNCWQDYETLDFLEDRKKAEAIFHKFDETDLPDFIKRNLAENRNG